MKLPAHSDETPHSKKLCGYPYVEYPIANTYELANGHSCQSSVWTWCEPYGTQLEAPHSFCCGVILMLSTPNQTPTKWTLWQIAIAIRAVYGVGVKLPAHSYKAPHSKKLWGYPYVEYPIANIYEVDLWTLWHPYSKKQLGESYMSPLTWTLW